jgi:hypothetical protein
MKNNRTFNSLPTYGEIESGLFHKPDVVGSASVVILGERNFWDCPFCEKHTQDLGDRRNPNGIVVGEMICTDCRKKIRGLIGL